MKTIDLLKNYGGYCSYGSECVRLGVKPLIEHLSDCAKKRDVDFMDNGEVYVRDGDILWAFQPVESVQHPMRIYQKNPNRTAQKIAELIKAKEVEISVTNGKRYVIKPISYQAFMLMDYYSDKWLGNTTLASLVEELLDGKYNVKITPRYCGKHDWKYDCFIDIEWKIVES